MSKIAVIKTGGKQYKVKEGQAIKIEKLALDNGQAVEFETLLIAGEDGKNVNIGMPLVEGKVSGKILEQGKAEKVAVVKYKNKTRYLRNLGHRQRFTKVMIEKIA